MSTFSREDSGRTQGNPFQSPALAQRYEQWYLEAGRRADTLEKALLGKLLCTFPNARTALEVGCGTGHFTRWMAGKGFDTVGLDASQPMLKEARRYDGSQYLLGDASALPLADRSFDLVALITTLEFVPDPARALAEAIRVARQGVLLGVLNRYSLLAMRHHLSGKTLWRSARFFGPGDLADIVEQAAGSRIRALRWRTTLWPIPGVTDLRLPWGGFIGMAVRLREESDR
jgi:SAM-dependent methyltransferase